jgi:hypothetical protein
MNQRRAHVHLAVASLLTMLLLTMAAVPANGADLRRRQGSEDLAYRLTNCLRTGGYVTRAGKCMGYGSGRFSKYVKPLKRSHKIGNKVAWPWARKSVRFYGTRTCWIGHARNASTVDSRFASVALRHTVNGENMGCGFYGKPSATVVRVVRMWQYEKRYNGWHWRQVKSRDFRSVGVGVASLGQRKAQIVIDFYGETVK